MAANGVSEKSAVCTPSERTILDMMDHQKIVNEEVARAVIHEGIRHAVKEANAEMVGEILEHLNRFQENVRASASAVDKVARLLCSLDEDAYDERDTSRLARNILAIVQDRKVKRSKRRAAATKKPKQRKAKRVRKANR